MFSSRSISSFLILLLWAISLLSVLVLLRYGKLFPDEQEKNRRSSLIYKNATSSSFHSDSLPWQPDQAIYPGVVQDSLDEMLMVFNTRSSFIEYFRYQYDEEELSQSLQIAGETKDGSLIEVKPRKGFGGKKFDQKYRVKVRFTIKPLPQP